jgi:hypothetical protein
MNAKTHQTKALKNRKPLGSELLKERYLQCFGVRANSATMLQGIVKNLIEEGVSRQTLVAWAVKAGYTKGNVSSLLSRILVSLGLRERKKGAGRKPSPAALELLAHAQSLHGEECLNVLRAAWRAGKAQLAAANNETRDRASGLIVSHNCRIRDLIMAPQLDGVVQPDGASAGIVPQPSKKTFIPQPESAVKIVACNEN